MTMKSALKHPLLGEITLSQSLRAKRITISVKPSGEVRLSYPVYVSTRRAVGFLDSKVEWIMAARHRMAEKRVLQPRFSREETENLRRQAKEVLPARVEALARQFGFRYEKITVRATRSKWGSCSAKNSISLSLYLMTLPQHLIDYVIIHELCHTLHHDHSPRFHELLNRCLHGCEKELRRELRSYSTGVTEK